MKQPAYENENLLNDTDIKCHACENKYTEMIALNRSWRKLYRCSNCEHIYIDYTGNEVEYHAKTYRSKGNEAYRKNIHSDKLLEICEKRVDWIKNNVAFEKGKKYNCYEIGSGAGTFAREMSKHLSCEYTCNEISQIMLDECERLGFKTDNTDVNKIKFDKKYDFIFAWHVLEHIKDFPPLVENIRQNLNGKLILEVPTNNISKLNRKNKWEGHSHYFSQKSFNLYFTNSGFNIIKMVDGIQSKDIRPSILAVLEKK